VASRLVGSLLVHSNRNYCFNKTQEICCVLTCLVFHLFNRLFTSKTDHCKAVPSKQVELYLNTHDIKWDLIPFFPLQISKEICRLLSYSGWQTCADGSNHRSGETGDTWELLYRSGWRNAEGM